MADKRNIINEYRQFCFNNRLVESYETASYFAELYLNKETKINGRRIASLYAYIDSKKE